MQDEAPDLYSPRLQQEREELMWLVGRLCVVLETQAAPHNFCEKAFAPSNI
jgi:hypothetical protein